ncbi:bile acid:sodium symporter family protein [Thalassotalea litorea]|uniref:Bile acid:sodium symporter family protein n=1 Tax=Thalassotalea litorea TaxID=2020715 RepID=A0A5R9IKK6_9GAMM|nr:bile acid:sodium symporter family protein [Thalassotalea litorea]TLU61827.1 bile acid:sodium symporter family protein [Thalassotalea litorea]
MEIGPVFYDSSAQWMLNLVLASMIFGLALDIHWQDFKRVITMPKAVIAGLGAQFLLLPALTCALTLLVDLPPGIELGMMLVASCPGGAISNFVTHLSGGNTALSISLTAAASATAVIMMPINFMFWSQFNEPAMAIMHAIDVDSEQLFKSLILVLAIPLSGGLLIRAKFENAAKILHKLLKNTSLLALIAFILIAVVKNNQAFLQHLWFLLMIVVVHNGMAFLLGYLSARSAGLDVRDQKAVTIEVGMQNASLAIAIVFTQFDGQAGMALICAFWGTWHIVAGLTVALIFKQQKSNQALTKRGEKT